jgi:hypothetical protein
VQIPLLSFAQLGSHIQEPEPVVIVVSAVPCRQFNALQPKPERPGKHWSQLVPVYPVAHTEQFPVESFVHPGEQIQEPMVVSLVLGMLFVEHCKVGQPKPDRPGKHWSQLVPV